MSELRLRAEAIGAEISRLRREARAIGDHELHDALKELDRRTIGDGEKAHATLIETLRGRLTPEVAEAIRPDVRREVVLEHQATADRLEQREQQLEQREQELERRPKSRTPWVAAGAIPAAVVTTIITMVV